MQGVLRISAVVLFCALASAALVTTVQAQSSYAEQVQEMYIAYYGRPGDPEGVEFWAGRLSDGNGDLAAIIDAFGTSAEYNDSFSDLSDEALINNIYLSLFGRDADTGGLGFYLERLQSGAMTLASIALNVSDGVQDGSADAAIVDNKLAVAATFTDTVAESGAVYGSEQIDAAVALLAAVNDSQDSVDAALGNIDTLLGITPDNHAPLADAGLDQMINVGDTVTLDGSGSADSDGDALDYHWTIIGLPTGSNAMLDSDSAIAPRFQADVPGTYELSLLVNDGSEDSATDTVTVTADNDNVDITDKIFANLSGNCSNYAGSYFSNVTDIKRAMNFMGDIVISSQGNKCTIQSNDIPNHDFNDASASFANNVAEQNLYFEIPASPSFTSSATALQLGVTEAVMLNGVSMDLLAAACYGIGNEPLGREKIGCGFDQNDNPWRYDPMSPLNNFGTDANNAHTQPGGLYHYHGNPMAMFVQDCAGAATPSPLIGFAADGFPIYGSCFRDPDTGQVRKAEPSYVLKNGGSQRQAVTGYTTPVGGVGGIASDNYDGQFRGDWEYQADAGDLDECNGMSIDAQYGYYVTDTFPWVNNCFKGVPDNSFGGAVQMRSHSHAETL